MVTGGTLILPLVLLLPKPNLGTPAEKKDENMVGVGEVVSQVIECEV